jgi:hypothetical protein
MDEKSSMPMPVSAPKEVSEKLSDYTPIKVLVDTLKSDDVKRRVKAIESLPEFCIALGPRRTREEVVPFIKGSLLLSRVHGG